MEYQAAVITVSDGCSAGIRTDTSGPAVRAMLEGAGYRVLHTAVVPDDKLTISRELCRCADELGCDLVLTTGGTGLSPRDVQKLVVQVFALIQPPSGIQNVGLEHRPKQPPKGKTIVFEKSSDRQRCGTEHTQPACVLLSDGVFEQKISSHGNCNSAEGAAELPCRQSEEDRFVIVSHFTIDTDFHSHLQEKEECFCTPHRVYSI